jgi:hypothetical protein
MPSLYRRLLGPSFDTLPASLRDFHDVESEWHGHSLFTVTRAPGLLRGLVANLGGLPRSGQVPMRLTLRAEGPRERWIRHFGSQRLESVQWTENGLLLEQFGSLRFGFRLLVEPPALRLKHERTWVLGVPFPRPLGPMGSGEEIGRQDGCAIVARAFAPLLGQLVQYEGLVLKGAPSAP